MAKQYRPGDMRIMPDPLAPLWKASDAHLEHETVKRLEHEEKISERAQKAKADAKAEEAEITNNQTKTKAFFHPT